MLAEVANVVGGAGGGVRGLCTSDARYWHTDTAAAYNSMFGSTLRFDRHTHYLQLISAEHGLDRRGSRGCTEQLLKETELPVIGAGRPRHYLTQVLLLAEQDVGSLQEPQSYLLLPQ